MRGNQMKQLKRKIRELKIPYFNKSDKSKNMNKTAHESKNSNNNIE
jgi:hypothetical protein